MSTLTIETLEKIIENMPRDYTVEFKKEENIISPISDTVEFDVTNNRLILKF